MAGVSSLPSGLVPVHVGQPEPGSEQERQLLLQQRADPRTRQRPLRVPAGLAWQQLGVEPRWLGMETSDCPVALEPNVFHNQAAELKRLLVGAARRSEPALVVATAGDVDDNQPRYPLSSYDTSVNLGSLYTSVAGRRLPAGSRPVIAADLDPADRDLALRLLTRPADAPWWALELHGATEYPGGGFGGPTIHEPEGELHPILVDALGDPVVAAWIPSSGDQRWYVIPDATDWATILDWLVQRALPAFVPAALRRVRSPHFVDPDLQTADELVAGQALADLEARYIEERLTLEDELRRAETAAEPIRYGLLYGSGADLVAAVQAVLTTAGLTTVDLDKELGSKSADLLVQAGTQRWLVEVKAASGAAPESQVGHLQRHLATWPQLRPDEPVDGGVLIVNHQHKLHPGERTPTVYSRPEFVATLTVPVISTVELFGWWRTGDWASIRAAVLGARSVTGTQAAEAPQRRRRWWPAARSQ
jgi:hypothetical protein